MADRRRRGRYGGPSGGQYRGGVVGASTAAGYLEEPGVGEASRTETFVAIKAEIDTWRWAGVPFYLRTGKRLHESVPGTRTRQPAGQAARRYGVSPRSR